MSRGSRRSTSRAPSAPSSSLAIPTPAHAPATRASRAGSLALGAGFVRQDHDRAKAVVRRGLTLTGSLPEEYELRLKAADRVLKRLDPEPRPVEATGGALTAGLVIRLQFEDARAMPAADYDLEPGDDDGEGEDAG